MPEYLSYFPLRFLIWSNEHHAWWGPAESGYTQHIDEAGRYRRDDADRICRHATVDGQLSTDRTDPVTGRPYREFSEVAVLAPPSNWLDEVES
jgi:hypothetical protein